MGTLTKTELDNILELHKKWLTGEYDGVKADLINTDLRGADLSGANLRFADLRFANLSDADLRFANLSDADLRNTDLRDANLRYVDLSDADLSGANLCNADLSDADLRNTDLRDADLRYADLSDADLSGANLHDANLNWVNWHESKGIKVYVAGLQSSRENAQLAYIPSLDIATTGCWQNNWANTKKRIHSIYAKGTRECKAYDVAIKYIEDQIELDINFDNKILRGLF